MAPSLNASNSSSYFSRGSRTAFTVLRVEVIAKGRQSGYFLAFSWKYSFFSFSASLISFFGVFCVFF